MTACNRVSQRVTACHSVSKRDKAWQIGKDFLFYVDGISQTEPVFKMACEFIRLIFLQTNSHGEPIDQIILC